ncbi:succinate--CoA ligase [GDP-forming] subunit beta, mitochondrial-like [Homarus americanus]|uniref:Succinate--CoA ligase [GDP-forming] subunit beta, mitochondrial n=1 Tax=Homarus americanus TaxID=6706 RepID=A0A8J5N586_HOMAM|nr:succinate--CoA ligase [GDP-forming] subunit beta, mitochondrial-like [Homarus americanus]KAG7173065.1 Succinate--CoA ligase [GDP-forming] subunit beta, mitochondrial-like [Homarus americanus]
MAAIITRCLSKGVYTPLQTLIKPKVPVRCLNLLEYQSKVLLENHGVTVQRFRILDSHKEAVEASKSLNAAEFVVKAQILAGGRGKGHFDNGFKGGVHLTKDCNEVASLVEKMVGHKLVTKQTPKDGIVVNKVMVAESVDILRETYFCILMDREHNGPVLIASPDGGMDIEEVAEKTPERLMTQPIDIHEGITDEMALKVADFLKFNGPLREKCAKEVKGIWSMFLGVDATQIEINPLIETPQGQVVAVDAKIQFDDNAEFRQKDVFAMEDYSESDPREVEAARYNLTYIGMDGNIGCLVNGAGLAMATMDIIKLHGGSPANFLDLGGGVQEHQVEQAVRILTSDESVKALFVNIFGGIVNTATIASGLVKVLRDRDIKIPLVVRLEGTNVDEAKRILAESGCDIQSANNLDEAARKAVSAIN